jgi:hypothetical protein
MEDKITNKDEQYSKPRITDHGDLTELTAGLANGRTTDAAFPSHTVATFVSGP